MVSRRGRDDSARQAIFQAARPSSPPAGSTAPRSTASPPSPASTRRSCTTTSEQGGALPRDPPRPLRRRRHGRVARPRRGRHAGGAAARVHRALAREAIARPHFPPIWLREMADGGRHVDATVVGEVQRVLATLAGTLADGRRRGGSAARIRSSPSSASSAPLLMFSGVGAGARTLRQSRAGGARAGRSGRDDRARRADRPDARWRRRSRAMPSLVHGDPADDAQSHICRDGH